MKAISMKPVLLICGIHNSGPTHWQSLWEGRHARATRVVQRDWDRPVCADWVQALDQAVQAAGEPPILVAHSLGCLALAHWAALPGRAPAHRALLVAVPDPEGPAFPAAASGFAPLPETLDNLAATMLSSSDDPFSTPAYTQRRAAQWKAEHVCLRALGHINGQSGLADWPQGWAIVDGWRREAQKASLSF
jgi:predicted alpha/beta hydrolase family esterase